MNWEAFFVVLKAAAYLFGMLVNLFALAGVVSWVEAHYDSRTWPDVAVLFLGGTLSVAFWAGVLA